MNEKKYNGWTNYETWDVKLWLDNDQGSQESCLDLARGSRDTSNPEYELANALRGMVEEDAPDLGASMYADLLGAAIGEVNWREIAESYLEDIKDEDEEEK